jgi:hypothetical protein
MKTQDQMAIRMYVRAYDDFQAMRKAMDNRLGRTADGKKQDLKQGRDFSQADLENFTAISMEARRNEKAIEKMLAKAIKRFPIWTEYLLGVKGVGAVSAGWIIGSFDIHEAMTVSKMWQYAGLNPGMVRGKKRVAADKYKPAMGEIVSIIMDEDGKPKDYIIITDTLVRGDKATPGFVLPFNKRLRVALVGVLATNGFIKGKTPYALNYYYPYKARLEQEANGVNSPGNKDEGKKWKDVSPGHRDKAARRYMIKTFLKDLYVAWRTLEGLPVREPYAEEYLGKVHSG